MSQLFDTFEINRVPRWPLMSRLVALSVVLHGVFLVAVVYVPTLRGLLRVASSMSGIEFVSQDYDKTLLGQRATIIQLGPHEQLFYPPDYFGSPEVAETTQFDPMVIQQPTPPPPPPTYRSRRVRTPKPAPEPTPTPEVAQATPTPTPVSDEERKKAEEDLTEAEKKTGLKRPNINPAPWVDVAKDGKELFDAGKLNLNTTVEVSAKAERETDGRFKPDSVVYAWKTVPDETTDLLARKVVTAVSESRMLSTLDGAKDVDMSLKVDEKEIAILIGNKFPSAAEAEKFANGYGVFLWAARIASSGSEEGELFNKMKIKQEGDRLVITFNIPKDVAGKMISGMLDKKAAKDKATAATQSKAEAGAAATP